MKEISLSKKQKIAGSGFFFILLILAFQGYAQYEPLSDWMEQNTKKLGGRAMLAVYKNDSMVYIRSVGDMSRRQKNINKYVANKMGAEADLDNYSMDSRVLIASCSKWYSAALVMSFVDEGKLRLTDTVGAYLPVLTAHGKGNITIGECLSHLTGVQAPPLKKSLQGIKNMRSMDQALEEIANMPMEGEPGKVFHYSNVGLQIAGSVLEKISGESFEQLFAERIARPLEMKNTDFGHKAFVLPAGGAVSTGADYMNFLIMILHQGNFKGKQVLSAASVHEMQINRLGTGITISYTPAEQKETGYGYGEWVMQKSDAAHATTWVSSPGLFGSFPWVDNENGYCAFLLTFNLNNNGRQELYQDLKKLVDESVR